MLDDAGVPIQVHQAGYQPTSIAQYALSQWNHYLATNDERHRQIFLAQALWLVEHEARIGNDAGGWPISHPHPDVRGESPWLSALAQGNALSVLVRAYQLTQEEVFLEVARRAVRTFHLDILDGGVSAPLGEVGIYFEEVAVYPATHILSGFIFALFGLYDYVALTGDVQTERLIFRSLATMHSLVDEFDVSFWTCSDLLHRHLASPAHLELQAELLEALAKYNGCEHCSRLASRWKNYRLNVGSRLYYLINKHCTCLGSLLLSRLRSVLFPKRQVSSFLRVCVPIGTFPFTGGMHTVLANIKQVTQDIWQMEYLTQYVGPNTEGYIIHQYGTAKMGTWQFPAVWLHFLAGFKKLISLVRHPPGYSIILPQDGVTTGAFASLVAKLAGVRVVCIDHGDLGFLRSSIYRDERVKALTTRHWFRRMLAHFQLMWYWPSLFLFARLNAAFIDHLLIPGVAGDGVEEICEQLGVHQSRITRFANMIDMNRHVIPDADRKAQMREKIGILSDAIVITMICRLAPEKGLDIALEAISQALSALPPRTRTQVRIIIVGDGPERKQVEEDVRRRGLSEALVFLGEVPTTDVISILGVSDIFLYTSRRAAGYPLAILEAMASGCAVISSSVPLANVRMLAEERGIVVPVGDIERTCLALIRLLSNPALCRQMGDLAREYIAMHHSPAAFRRTLRRATYWSGLDELLTIGM